MSKLLLAFDLYGTLLSTESVAKRLSKHFGQDKAASVAATWRRYQLEYTWRYNSMSDSVSPSSLFSSLTLSRTICFFR